jgi:hypothetical protein
MGRGASGVAHLQLAEPPIAGQRNTRKLRTRPCTPTPIAPHMCVAPCTASQHVALRRSTMHGDYRAALRCIMLHCAAEGSAALHHVALRCALHCVAAKCTGSPRCNVWRCLTPLAPCCIQQGANAGSDVGVLVTCRFRPSLRLRRPCRVAPSYAVLQRCTCLCGAGSMMHCAAARYITMLYRSNTTLQNRTHVAAACGRGACGQRRARGASARRRRCSSSKLPVADYYATSSATRCSNAECGQCSSVCSGAISSEARRVSARFLL